LPQNRDLCFFSLAGIRGRDNLVDGSMQRSDWLFGHNVFLHGQPVLIEFGAMVWTQSSVWNFRTIKLSSAFEADLVPSAFDRKYPAQLTVTAPEDEFEDPK
jgi:hypothetical protein